MKPLLIGIAGFAQVGKDTAAKHLHDKHGYHHDSFASTLRTLAEEVNPLLDAEHGSYRRVLREHGYEEAKAKVPGFREFLKALGNGVRKVIGADTWIRATLDDVSDYTVISDVRFLNEADAIRAQAEKMGGKAVIIRLVRPGHSAESSFEEEVPFIVPDYIVDNAFTIEDLHAALDAVIDHAAKADAHQGRLF